MREMHRSPVLTYLPHCNKRPHFRYRQRSESACLGPRTTLCGETLMFVANILRVVMRVVNAIAYANQLKAERLMKQHMARAGKLGLDF